MVQYIAVAFLVFFCLKLNAQDQYDSNWVFGEVGGVLINFKDNNLIISNVETNFELVSTNASISDKNGIIQFFTNGCEIRNRNYEIMKNGSSVGLPQIPFCSSNFNPLTNSAAIIPDKSNEDVYYILHIGFSQNESDTSSLFLTTVDMKGDNGLGEVVEKKSLVFTDNLSRFGLELTYDQNNEDWWVILPKYFTNCFHILKFQSGEFTQDTIQCLGEKWESDDIQHQHDFSPDGKKYARFSYLHGLNILDFDNTTGLFSNPIKIDFNFTDTIYHSGVIFSPNSRFVYASAFNNVFQFDLESNNIAESRELVATLNTPDTIMFPTRFKRGALAPNGKIYIGGRTQFNYLHTIHNPDCKGVLCNFEQYALRISDFPHFSSQGVPSIPHFRSQPQNIDCDTVTVLTNTNQIAKQNIEHEIYPNPFLDILDITVGELSTGFTFKMYDLLGKEILSTDALSSSIQIDLRYLLDGLYFYQILNKSDQVANGKLQKISY